LKDREAKANESEGMRMFVNIFRNMSGESLDSSERKNFCQRAARAEAMLEEKYGELLEESIEGHEIEVYWNMNTPIVGRVFGCDELLVVSYRMRALSSAAFQIRFVDKISTDGKITIDPDSFAGLEHAPNALLDYLSHDFDDFVEIVEQTLSRVQACIERNDSRDREPKADLIH
jgi:hypothetical protein